MVDRDINRNRSLSADSDLHSSYETFRAGDYKSSLAFVEKKLQKLNSPLDKFNFNILLALIYSKSNRLQDSHKLCESLKNEMIKNNYFSTVPEICNYFKNTMRELDEDKILKEIFEYQMKNLNLVKIDNKHQKKILKELTLNLELNEMYSKINVFLKNENEPNLELLNLLKYEVVYILCFKLQKLSKFIGSAIFKEMNSKYETLKSQKGFLDIMIKFLIGLNDTENFLKLFEGTTYEFTNAPVDDLLVNIYYNQKNQDEKLVNFLLQSIKNNLDKCNFNNFSRVVLFMFYQLNILISSNENLNEGDYSFFFDLESNYDLNFDQTSFDNFTFTINTSIKDKFLGLYSFFSFIKNNNEMKIKNFNTYKSSILALLLYLHFLKITLTDHASVEQSKILGVKIEKLIFQLIFELLENSVTKQSILMELSKYFVYLNKESREEILEKFFYDLDLTNNSNTGLSNEDKEKIIFYQKLKKLLLFQIGGNLNQNTNPDSEIPLDPVSLFSELDKVDKYINEIISLYFVVTKNSKKLEKGERLLGDDLVILINEALFDLTNKFDLTGFSHNEEVSEKFSKIIYNCYALDYIAYERSPYNYDISLIYLRLCGYLGLNAKLFSILTTMNLKGPQFESVSYIAHRFFLNSQFKQGLMYLYGNLDKWQKDNKRCSRKTLWKMFTGRNFWDTEELIDFLNENENSYYKLINEFHEISVNYINPMHIAKPDQIKQNELLNYFETLKHHLKIMENKMDNKTLNKNQDVIINNFKYKYVPYSGDKMEFLKTNRNYQEKNFIFKFAIDKLNKNNFIFENTPGYKNNFFIQEDISVFGNFENENFLYLNFLTNILKVNLKFNFNCDLTKNENKEVKQGQLDLDQAYIKEILEKANFLISEENQKNILESQKIFKNEFEFVYNLEKLLVQFFKFEFENGSNFEGFETNFNKVTEILNKLLEITVKSSDFSNFKNSYKNLNHIHKTSLVNKLKIFARFYLPAFGLLTAKINNFINFNKNSFKNPANLKSSINSLFKSSFLNFFSNLESLSNDSDEVGKIENYLINKEFMEYNSLPSKIKTQIRKNIEENTREIKEIVKSIVTFLREML